ncbi:MAG: PEGA domain-containing protein [Archangium sp.]|nr:PEGA domain-containing protein [Archangium sp.]
MNVSRAVLVGCLVCGAAQAAPRTLVVGAGECQSVELVTGLNDFSGALREKLKSDLYEPDVVLDIVRPRPTRSLEDVERQVESARTLFYNGQNDRALDLLKQALSELERAPIAGQPWKVAAQALALQGVVSQTMGKKADAIDAFRRVLRVDPTHALSTDEYTPSVIAQFEVLRKELARQKKSTVQVQSSTPGAEVLIEGRVMGVTPLKLELPAASYRLMVRTADRASFLRVVSVPRDSQVQIDLATEGVLSAQAPLCLGAKDKAAEAAALKLANTVTADDLIVVRLEGARGVPGQFVASRYEIRTGSMVREGRVQTPSRGKPAFGALATFVLTGQGAAVIVSPEAPAPIAVATPPPTQPVEKTPEKPVEVPAAPPSVQATTSLSTARLVSFVLMGAGGATLIGGIAAWSTGASDRSRLAMLVQANKLPDPSDPGHREALDVISRVDGNQTLSFSLMAAGVGMAAAGLATFLLFPAETTTITAMPSAQGGSVFVSGSF